MYNSSFMMIPSNSMYQTAVKGYYHGFLNELGTLEQRLFGSQHCMKHVTRCFEYPWVVFNSDLRCFHKVLDAGGGGNSVFPYYVSQFCKEVHIVDLAPEPTKWLVEGVPSNIVLNKADITNLSMVYSDGVFDRVFCISVLEHMKGDKQLLVMDELLRVLKKGGVLVVTLDLHVTPEHCPLRRPQLEKIVGRLGVEFVEPDVSDKLVFRTAEDVYFFIVCIKKVKE